MEPNVRGDTNFKALTTYGCELTEKVEKLDHVIGRDDEMRKVITILSMMKKNSPLLIGDSSAGKTAVVEGLVQRILSGDVPSCLNGVRVISLDTQALVVGDKYSGEEFEDILKAVLKEVKEADGMVILFIDEIHLLLGASRSTDATLYLKLMLKSGRLRCIGATTPEEFRKYVEKTDAFESCFQQVLVSESNISDTVSILRGLKRRYETHHCIQILDDALVVTTQLSSRYLTGFLPDKAIDILDEACASLRAQLKSQPKEIADLERKKTYLELEFHSLEKEQDSASKTRLVKVTKELADFRDKLQPLITKYKKDQEKIDEILRLKEKRKEVLVAIQKANTSCKGLIYRQLEEVDKALAELEGAMDKSVLNVGSDQIARAVSRRIGIPVRVGTMETEWLNGLAKSLSQKVVGQDEAVKAVTSAMKRSKVGFGSTQKPICSFLFVGTNDGKIELAKALTEEMFGDENLLIKIRFSEYKKIQSVAQLISFPCGSPERLTEAVRRRPHSVVLFDEIENADPLVLDKLLPILDEGYLADPQDCMVDFINTIVIMTSNVGVNYFSSAHSNLQKTKIIMTEVRNRFKRLLTLLDNIVIFTPLSQDQPKEVASDRAVPDEPGKAAKKQKI